MDEFTNEENDDPGCEDCPGLDCEDYFACPMFLPVNELIRFLAAENLKTANERR
jgi:hypothetical protein